MKIKFLLIALCMHTMLLAQNNAGLFRFPDVSASEIVFSYANDLWVVAKNGGQAYKISSPPGQESFPRFSPDGKNVAFTANYDGNFDVYRTSIQGGLPVRLTYFGGTDRVVDWAPDGKNILFASGRESGKERFNQFYSINLNGGPATKLPLAYAEYGSYSPDGSQLAVVFRSQAFRNWKRYRGGTTADIYIFDFKTNTSKNISADTDAGEEFPMWVGNDIYFISDRGKENRMNLWRYNISNGSRQQLTSYTDFDIQFPASGPGDIVYEQGGYIHLFNIASGQDKKVDIHIATDEMALHSRTENVQSLIFNTNISPDGKRVVMEARGDIFSLPATEGFVKNITASSQAADRYPSWSPDGTKLAWWSDETGEYQLYIKDLKNELPAKKITNYKNGFRYHTFWSPDSKKIATIDQAGVIQIISIANGNIEKVDQALRWADGPLRSFTPSWSPDSRYLAYHRDLENQHEGIFIYDADEKKSHTVTSGFYNATNPQFDPGGKYLYLLTGQNFNPVYSDLDNTFVYPNTTMVGVISLQKNTPYVLAPKNDSVTYKITEEEKLPKADSAKVVKKKKEKGIAELKQAAKNTVIDFDGMEERLYLLPVKPGNISNLQATNEKIYYLRFANAGSDGEAASLTYFDLDKKEEKTVMSNVNGYVLNFNTDKALVNAGGKYAVIPVSENAKIDKTVPVAEMVMQIDPKQEWKQMFNDVWRLERDYFYDANMHGVNWAGVKEKYGKLLESALTREDVNYLIGEMIGELNSSHTYQSGGDLERQRKTNVGYLGINWEADADYYKVGKIIRAGIWDAEVHSPLDISGVNIPEGSYILAVNGIPIKTDKEPYAAFAMLADKTVEITYNSKPDFKNAHTAIVKTLSNEFRLRYLNWVEGMRKRVEEATRGEVGYLFVPSTGVDGQNELVRQLNALSDKKALIVDERFNNGGQIPDRFIELLNRKPLVFWATRDGHPWHWPPNVLFGPRVMLINGWSGSGGDAFPYYFKKEKLGPLVGTRTWGGLIGISGVPSLIDGGSITVPSFRMYDENGWFKEGHGVDPDIQVPEDLGALAKGVDPQLEKAIETVMELMKTKGFSIPKVPEAEKR